MSIHYSISKINSLFKCQSTTQMSIQIFAVQNDVNPLLKCQFKYSLFKMIFEWQIDAIQIFAIQIDI